MPYLKQRLRLKLRLTLTLMPMPGMAITEGTEDMDVDMDIDLDTGVTDLMDMVIIIIPIGDHIFTNLGEGKMPIYTGFKIS